mmetsp:Transcript_29590/g.62758  ORF Transcript_29590/g.62758 Transcript_29590/m.62758 type:complete len:116 (+) Transcript_29590:619-966(+)
MVSPPSLELCGRMLSLYTPMQSDASSPVRQVASALSIRSNDGIVLKTERTCLRVVSWRENAPTIIGDSLKIRSSTNKLANIFCLCVGSNQYCFSLNEQQSKHEAHSEVRTGAVEI